LRFRSAQENPSGLTEKPHTNLLVVL